MKLEEPAQENADTLAIAIAVNNKILYFWLRNLMSLGQHSHHYGELAGYLDSGDPLKSFTMIVSRKKVQVKYPESKETLTARLRNHNVYLTVIK